MAVTQTLRQRFEPFSAIDRATMAYVAIVTVAVLWSYSGDVLPGAGWLLVAHGLLLALVLMAPRGADQ